MTSSLGTRMVTGAVLVAAVVILGLVVAFNVGGGDEETQDTPSARWEAAGLSDYRFVFQRNCFCPEDYRGPVEITVRDGAIEKVVYLEAGTGANGPYDAGAEADPANFETVDGLLALIDDAVAQDAARIDAAYDPELGYPTEVYIDYLETAIDEELGFQVSGLTPLD